MSTIKIIIADDHQLFRNGMTSLLAKVEDFNVIGEASDGEALLELLKTLEPHVVLVDISMPKLTGIEVMERAKKDFPKVKFIALTMYDDGQYVVKSVRSGAQGYLLKNTDEEELKHAIKEVFFGRKYFNSEISELMFTKMADAAPELKKLSTRENEVLQLVSQGKTTREIADELFVSTRTIETHRVNMMKKLHVQNSAELIKKAAQLDLI